MSEKIELEIIASKNNKSFQTIEDDLNQLQKPRAAEIALNLSQAKRELQELKSLQKDALKVENFDLADKIGQQVEIASKKVTTINRQLTNFQRTGNENISVLWKMFGSVESKMKQTFNGVMDQHWLLSVVVRIWEWLTSTQWKIIIFGTAILGLTGIIWAFATGALTLSWVLTALGISKLFAAGATWTFNGVLTAMWTLLSPILLAIAIGIAAVGAVITGLVWVWWLIHTGLQLVWEWFKKLWEWLNIEPIKKFGEALSWTWWKIKEFGERVGWWIKGIWDWVTGTDEATNSTQNLWNEVEITTQKVEKWDKTIQKTEESLTWLERATIDTDDMFQNLQNSVNSLIEEKEKLRTQFQNGEITIDEYNAKITETDEKLQIAKQSSDDFAKALDIVENNQLTYMERVAQMNALNLNAGAYNVLIAKVREVAWEAYKALQLKAQLLDQVIKHPPATLDIATRVVPWVNTAKNLWKGVIAGIDAFTDGKASKLLEQGKEKWMNFLKSKYQEVMNQVQITKNELEQLNKESEKAQQKAKEGAKKTKDKNSGWGW